MSLCSLQSIKLLESHEELNSQKNMLHQNVVVTLFIGKLRTTTNDGLCKGEKIRDYHGSGWVGPGLTRNFIFLNHPKIALNQY